MNILALGIIGDILPTKLLFGKEKETEVKLLDILYFLSEC
ncbi:MAG: hypothetical protein MRERC_5c045 [Mycoplasmataceae bacterium RC_NB112A]|nr:MAG: hypothetical protein MRERC_5c045 [Mycoplasmataceae bacterium RC_NB112A]